MTTMVKSKNLYVVLMAGGVGVRFWPFSRNARPKQFLDILGVGSSLLQSTYKRFLRVCLPENIFVVTSQEYVGLTREQLPDMQPHQVLAEPMRKNTGPCIAFAAAHIRALNNDAVMVVSPADHLILEEENFADIILKAADKARTQDNLITLGIRPTRPETGFGYIQFLESRQTLKKVKTFTEKPELSIAKKFVESGEFLWNSGIFIWGVQAISEAIEKYCPDIAEAFAEIGTAATSDPERLEKAYSVCKNISIDFGVMEKADNVFVIPANFTWSDLGSWGALHEASARDENNNHIEGLVLTYDTRNSFILGPKDKAMILQGLNGYLVCWLDDVLIVCEKDREDLFRRYVNDLREKPDGTQFL